jgi:anti-sigma factor RsiW
MEHSDIRHKLSEYIDGSVSNKERVEIEAHLETCTTCSNVLRELLKTVEYIETIQEMEPPA